MTSGRVTSEERLGGCIIVNPKLSDIYLQFHTSLVYVDAMRVHARCPTLSESQRSRKQFSVEFLVIRNLPMRITRFSPQIEFWRGTGS